MIIRKVLYFFVGRCNYESTAGLNIKFHTVLIIRNRARSVVIFEMYKLALIFTNNRLKLIFTAYNIYIKIKRL